MKVINKKEFGTIQMYCGECKTITEFESSEYTQRLGHQLIDHNPTRGCISRFFNEEKTRELIPSWTLEATCPVCKSYVHLYYPTGEESKFIESPFIGFGG